LLVADRPIAPAPLAVDRASRRASVFVVRLALRAAVLGPDRYHERGSALTRDLVTLTWFAPSPYTIRWAWSKFGTLGGSADPVLTVGLTRKATPRANSFDISPCFQFDILEKPSRARGFAVASVVANAPFCAVASVMPLIRHTSTRAALEALLAAKGISVGNINLVAFFPSGNGACRNLERSILFRRALRAYRGYPGTPTADTIAGNTAGTGNTTKGCVRGKRAHEDTEDE